MLHAVVGLDRRRTLAVTAAVLTLLLLLPSQRHSLVRHAQDAFAAAYYGLDPAMLGRREAAHPTPRCCADEGCLPAGEGAGRVAAVTYLRGQHYWPLFRQLECTLRRSNPGLELALMHVPGELPEALLAAARRMRVTLLPVPPLSFPNSYEGR